MKIRTISMSSMSLFVLVAAVLGAYAPASASLQLTVDQYIYQSAGGTTVDSSLIEGTLSVEQTGAQQLSFTLTNVSPDSAFAGGGAPATMILTGFGVQLSGVDITGGSVNVNGGSTPVNFGGHGSPDISDEWKYANQAVAGYNISGVLAIDSVVTSVNNGQSSNFSGSGSIHGPGFGAISALETEFGSSQAAAKDSIVLTLNLDGAAPSLASIDAGNVVLAFGSAELVAGQVPEPASLLVWGLIGMGGIGSAAYGHRKQAT